MAFVGVIFISLSSTNTTQSTNEVYSSQAFYVAEGGLERAGRYLLGREGVPPYTATSISVCNAITGASFTNISLGSGQFSVTGVYNSTSAAPATLFAATTATDTTIPVNSVSGYANFGQIMVDRELMNYTGITATGCPGGAPGCFTGVVRGASSLPHAVAQLGTSIAQTQCGLTSTGNSGTSQRVINQADVFQDGWAVGVNTGTNQPLMLHWDGTSWTNKTTNAPVIAANLTSVSMMSPGDGWAVSDGNNFIHWTGTAWVNPAVTGNPGTNPLSSVYMNSSVDGWAVGQFGGKKINQPYTVEWVATSTTSQWADTKSNLGDKANLNGVFCNSSADCWAVGDPDPIPGDKAQPLLVHYTSATGFWASYNSTLIAGVSTALSLRSVYCNNTTDCWAVGDGGELLHYNGAWAVQASSTANNFLSVFCADVTHCWAVGAGGTIIFGNTMGWAAQASPTTQTLQSVACFTASDCWAAGAGGTLIHWNGNAWSVDPQSGTPSTGTSVTPFQLNSISLVGPGKPETAWREAVQ